MFTPSLTWLLIARPKSQCTAALKANKVMVCQDVKAAKIEL